MTVKELSQLYFLKREIERDERRLKELRQEYGLKSPSIDDVPRGSGNGGSVELLAAEIIDLEAIIAAKRLQCVHEKTRLERYIGEIPDSQTRQIFELRFAERLSWSQVAARIGGGMAEDSVKKRCYRYIRENN